jgi:toxin ParE1/3/4
MTAGRRLIWSKDARDDLADIFDYLGTHASREVADRRLRDIETAAQRLTEWPLTGRPRRELGPKLRSWAVPPHIIFYCVTESAVEVVRVIDGRRDLDAIFDPD